MTKNEEDNIKNVCDEDKSFIHVLMELPEDKKILMQGILIGLDLQEKSKATIVVR